ncbi:unnamed protein product [Discula destructiva]
MAATSKTLLVIGSGPGIGRALTTLLASKRYNHIALIARRAEQLEIEKKAVEDTVGSHIKVKAYALDVVDTDALAKALDNVDEELGKPECIFYNAARVIPSQLLSHDVKEVEYDLKINVSAPYVVAQRYIPHLVDLARADKSAYPSFIVTSSMLPQHPLPFLFALSLVKAAQRNLMQSLNMTYAAQGINVGLINVAGQVSPEDKTWNPTNIAAKAWDWFAGYKENPTFEVVI